MSYTVLEWATPIAKTASAKEAVSVARNACQVQVTCTEWKGGYITIHNGKAIAKYFEGHDENGLKGNIPLDAQEIANNITSQLELELN